MLLATRYPRLAARVFGTPLAIAQPRLDAMLGFLVPRLTGGDVPPAPAGTRERKLERREVHRAQLEGAAAAQATAPVRVAVIPIHGAMSLRGGVDADSTDLRAYEEIRQDLRAALEAKDVDAILFDVDSPGGECAGLPELGAEVLAARGQKPIWALANTDMCSAAYWLGASCDRVLATPSASVGSIGVVAAHVDVSAMDAQRGVRWTFLHAGERKVDGHAHAPLPDPVRARVQADLDRLYGEFVDHVAKAREIDPSAVLATKADVLHAQAALEAGLIDGLATFDEALEQLAGAATPSHEDLMTIEELKAQSAKLEAELATARATAETQRATIVELQAIVDAGKKKAAEERTAKLDAVVQGVVDACIKAKVTPPAAAERAKIRKALDVDEELGRELALAVQGRCLAGRGVSLHPLTPATEEAADVKERKAFLAGVNARLAAHTPTPAAEPAAEED